MKAVESNGVRLSYSENGTGADLVLVHGIPTDYRAWDAQTAPFSNGNHVIAYSRRLAQPNSNTGSFIDSTIETNAADLESLIQKIASPPVNLVGHSYGGFIAAYLASTRPQLIKKLVLIEPGVTTLLVKDPKSRGQALSLLFRSPSVALAARAYIKNYYDPLLDAYHRGDMEKALQYFLDGLMNTNDALDKLPEGVKLMVRENAKTIGEVEAKLPPFTKREASRVGAPTLLINGANGSKIFLAINRELAKAIPNSEHALIPDSSHFPHFENPDKFNERVLQFLEK